MSGVTEDLDVPRDEAIEVEALLRRVSPDVAALVDEHIEDNDEVLPTLLLADAARWYVEVVTSGLGLDAAHRLLDELEASYREAGANLRNTIATGFLETLPDPDEKGRGSVDLLPSSLREKLDRMEIGHRT